MTQYAAVPSEASPLLAPRAPILVPDEACPIADSSSQSPSSRPDDEEDHDEDHVIVTASTTRIVVMMGAALISMFLTALDHTILATLSGPVSASLASMAVLPYLGAVFTAMMTPSLALTGRFSDIFGRGRLLALGVATVGIGNLLCGIAPEKEEGADRNFWGVAVFLAGRVLAGIGAGPTLTAPALLTGDLVAPESRGFSNGLASMVWGVGCILGAFFGGVVNDSFGWRMAFLGQVPVCAVVTIVSYYIIDIPPRVSKSGKSYMQRIDFAGAFLTVLWLILFQVALNAGGVIVPWSHPIIPILFTLSAITFAVFMRTELKSPHPIIPVRAFFDRTVLMAGTTAFLSVTMYCLALYNYPLFFQVIAGESATQAGLRLLNMSTGTILGAFSAGSLTKITGRYVPIGLGGMLIAGLGFLGLFLLPLEAVGSSGSIAFSRVNFCIFATGLGLGTGGTITTLAAFAASPPRLHAVVQTSVQLFREVGSTFGIAASAAVLENVMRMRLWAKFGDMPGAEHEIDHILDAIFKGEFPSGWQKEDIVGAFMDGFSGVWIMAAGVSVLAILTVALMREHPLI